MEYRELSIRGRTNVELNVVGAEIERLRWKESYFLCSYVRWREYG